MGVGRGGPQKLMPINILFRSLGDPPPALPPHLAEGGGSKQLHKASRGGRGGNTTLLGKEHFAGQGTLEFQ